MYLARKYPVSCLLGYPILYPKTPQPRRFRFLILEWKVMWFWQTPAEIQHWIWTRKHQFLTVFFIFIVLWGPTKPPIKQKSTISWHYIPCICLNHHQFCPGNMYLATLKYFTNLHFPWFIRDLPYTKPPTIWGDNRSCEVTMYPNRPGKNGFLPCIQLRDSDSLNHFSHKPR